MAAWVQCYKDSLCGMERCDVCEESCEMVQLTLKKLSLERDRGAKFKNRAVNGAYYSSRTFCFHNARAMLMDSMIMSG